MKYLKLSVEKGDPIEKIYYTAVYLAQPDKVREYNDAWKKKREPHYWYSLYREHVSREAMLISAVVNVCDAPFGAYVLEKWDADEIVLSPWLYSSKFDRQAMLDKIFAEGATEADLESYERLFKLTGYFMGWLDKREKKKSKR